MSKNRLWLLIAIVAIGLIGTASIAFANPAGTVPIFDHDGNLIAPGSSVPYSPKMTCSGCHFENCADPGQGGQPNPRGWCLTPRVKQGVDIPGVEEVPCKTGSNRMCLPTMETPRGPRLINGVLVDPIDRGDYEDTTANATKDHGPGTSTYTTPYPKHGVSASRHTQQGRNWTWGTTQRNFYGQPNFQPSVGMYGEWDIFTNSHLAHLTESDPKKFDMGSFDFTYSICGGCHPGGGSLEYDRAGYRYDGRLGMHHPGGSNPNKDQHKGDYYAFRNGQLVSVANEWTNKGVAEVDCLMCHMPASAGLRYAIQERYVAFTEPGGYNPSGHAATTLKSAGASASIGLARTPLIQDITLGGSPILGLPIANSVLDNWKWSNAVTGNDPELHVRAPRVAVNFTEKENCAICHFPDLSDGAPGPILGLPLGATHYQKLILGTLVGGNVAGNPNISVSDDPDLVSGGKNLLPWVGILPRIQGLKRGTAINSPLNPPDPMMDTAMLGKVKHNPNERTKTRCSTCHYLIESGEYGPVKDANGNVILPKVEAKVMDHKFAHGQSTPDTDDMDQLDGTVSCQTCHINKTHPDPYLNDNAPVPTHAGYPAHHFNKIDCKTCHIPVLNSLFHLYTIDYSAGPYRGTLRVDAAVTDGLGPTLDTVLKATLGTNDPVYTRANIFDDGAAVKPLYMWQKRKEGMRIVPVKPVVSVIWFDGNKPTFQKAAAGAAQELRESIGDGNSDGVYDFALNRPKVINPNLPFDDGHGVPIMLSLRESVFAARSASEITGMANMLNSEAVANDYGFERVLDPILNLGVNLYSISHNVMPITRNSQGKAIPGTTATYKTGTGETFTRKTGPLGINGCIECHSSSNPNSQNYSPASVGFFDKEYVLFRDVAGGVKQVEANIGGSGLKKRVRFAIDKLKKQDGTDHSVDLASNVNSGASIPNKVSQAEVLGYSSDKLAKLTQAIGTTKPQARLRVTRVKDNPATTTVDESARGLKVAFTDISLCPSGNCTKTTKVGEMVTTTVCDATTTVTTSEHTFSLAPGEWKGNFCAELSVTDTATGLNSTRTFPITLTKRNTRPTLTNVVVTSTVDRIPTITFTASDDDDASSELQVQVVWGDGTTETVAGDTGTVTKGTAYANRTKTYNVRLTVIDTKGGRTRVTQAVSITATSP